MHYLLVIVLGILCIGLIFTKNMSKKQLLIKNKLKTTVFYSEKADFLYEFIHQESTQKKACVIFLNREALELALDDEVISKESLEKYQENDFNSFIHKLTLFPTLFGVAIYYVKNDRLVRTMISREFLLEDN